MIEGRAHGWPVWTWLCFAAAIALAASFVMQLRGRATNGRVPLIDPAVFQVPGFRIGLLAVLTLFTGVASSFFVLALYLQQGRGLSPVGSGLVFTALAGTFSITSLAAARIGRWIGRAPLLPGALGMATGLALLGAAVVWFGVDGPVLWLLLPLAIDGAGMGLVMAPLASIVLAEQAAQHAGAAAGVLVTAQQFANALGVALIGVVFFGCLPHGGYGGAFAASIACLVVLSLLLACVVRRLRC